METQAQDQPANVAATDSKGGSAATTSSGGCDCLDQIEASLKEMYGEDGYELGLKIYMNFKTGKSRMGVPPCPLKIRKKKTDGTSEKKWTTSHISYSHCGWCGKPLVNDTPPNAQDSRQRGARQ